MNGIEQDEVDEAVAVTAISHNVEVEEVEVRAPTPERLPTPEPVVERRDSSPERRSRESSPERRDSSPEPPVREPSPEPVREPSPEPIREPSPEPVREPSPEPIREPSPEPVRVPSPKPGKKRISDDVSALLSKVDSQLSSSRISETVRNKKLICCAKYITLVWQRQSNSQSISCFTKMFSLCKIASDSIIEHTVPISSILFRNTSSIYIIRQKEVRNNGVFYNWDCIVIVSC